jgi:C4-dicarboxylate-specific signal transduction histidine kinase
MVKTNFEKITQNVLQIIDNSLKKCKINCEIEIKELSDFISYENDLKQVLLNLIKNAEDTLVKSRSDDRKIKIVIDKNMLRVEDNGGGVQEEIMEDIFQPYFSTKTKKDGTGLGLYMSKIIIEDHCQGSLDVSNNKEGAVFTIVLGGVA